MKLMQQILIAALAGFLLAQVLPWWSVAIAGALAAVLRPGHVGRSFLGGFMGIFLLWAGMAYWQMASTGSDFADKFAGLLPGGMSGMGLLLTAGIVGGLVAGLGGLSAGLLVGAVRGKNKGS